MKGITSIAHIALKVKDLDRSLNFYVNQMGFPEMFRLYKTDGSTILVFVRVTDEQYIEIFPDAVGDEAPGKDANGVTHICLGVDDIDVVVDQIKKAGIKLTVEKKMGDDRNYQAWIADPDGNRIELMQIMPDAMELEAIGRLRRENRIPA